MVQPFPSKRSSFYKNISDDQWGDWRWQMKNRLNTVEEFEHVLKLTDSEKKALSSPGLFRVDVTPYYVSLIDPEDPNDPIRKQIIPTAGELSAFTGQMEDSLAEDAPFSGTGVGASLSRPGIDARYHPMRFVLPLLHPCPHRWAIRLKRSKGKSLKRRLNTSSTHPRSGTCCFRAEIRWRLRLPSWRSSLPACAKSRMLKSSALARASRCSCPCVSPPS